MAHAIRSEQGHPVTPFHFPLICTREDLSFTSRDAQGLMVNWPKNNPGVKEDWKKGMAFFDEEISALASVDETAAYEAIQFAITGMGGRYTCLEIGFAQSVAAAAVLGLRALRNGGEGFAPVEKEYR
ncbi:hypothetical protein [Pseudomonas sp. CMR5c]|uniref:hypothetical protein n=1 Tax=Pseudomonas sp. CMR5c TaxID=658630 RepID=UPI000F585DF3|nr:hypothetical protein [Pseudomonas sp. CMR5c]